MEFLEARSNLTFRVHQALPGFDYNNHKTNKSPAISYRHNTTRTSHIRMVTKEGAITSIIARMVRGTCVLEKLTIITYQCAKSHFFFAENENIFLKQ